MSAIQTTSAAGATAPGAHRGDLGPPAAGVPFAAGAGIALGGAMFRCTGKPEGDMLDPTGVDRVVRTRRRGVVDRPWTSLTQVHGAAVAVVERPGGAAGRPADGAVSAVPGVALAVLTADCAPVAFASPEGVIGVAHAGWRGLVEGVIEETVSAMRRLGAGSVVAALGPCVHAECYAFGASDLDVAARRFGPAVRGATSDGQPALDIPHAVRVALGREGAELAVDVGICTSCSDDHWSWRARKDRQRQATVIWRP